MLQVSPTRNGNRTMQTTRKPMAWWGRRCLRPWWVWWGMVTIVGVVCGCERWCRIDLNCQLQIFRAYCRQDRQGNRVCISLFWNVSSSVLLCVLPQITSRCLQFFSFLFSFLQPTSGLKWSQVNIGFRFDPSRSLDAGQWAIPWCQEPGERKQSCAVPVTPLTPFTVEPNFLKIYRNI